MNQYVLKPAVASTPLSNEPFGDADYRQFETAAQSKYGVRLKDYKSEQMQRRLATLAKRQGARSFADYVSRLDRDAVLLQGMLDEVTINVTELLRNPDLFAQLGRDIIPALKATHKSGPFNVWSAGCSYGAEAYSVAMLLHELDQNAPYRVTGTDVDLTVVTRANSTSFVEADMKNVSEARRKANFQEVIDGRFTPSGHLKRNVSFSGHNLLADRYPPDTYDLICCRNVVIYFTDEAKDRIFRGFFSALRPGGVLFIGGSERISNFQQLGFEIVCPFFYRKPL